MITFSFSKGHLDLWARPRESHFPWGYPAEMAQKFCPGSRGIYKRPAPYAHSAQGARGTLNKLLHHRGWSLRRGLSFLPRSHQPVWETPAEAGKWTRLGARPLALGLQAVSERVSAARARVPPAQRVQSGLRNLTSGLARGSLADRLRPPALQRPRAVTGVSRRLRSRRWRGSRFQVTSDSLASWKPFPLPGVQPQAAKRLNAALRSTTPGSTPLRGGSWGAGLEPLRPTQPLYLFCWPPGAKISTPTGSRRDALPLGALALRFRARLGYLLRLRIQPWQQERVTDRRVSKSVQPRGPSARLDARVSLSLVPALWGSCDQVVPVSRLGCRRSLVIQIRPWGSPSPSGLAGSVRAVVPGLVASPPVQVRFVPVRINGPWRGVPVSGRAYSHNSVFSCEVGFSLCSCFLS